MTKVRIQRSDDIDHVPIAELELDTIPRIGESIAFPDDSGAFSHPWRVVFVTHELKSIHQRFIEHTVIVTIQPYKESLQEVYVEWRNEKERPTWISEDLRIECDSVPCQGDIIQIGINDEKYATEDAPIVVVEIIAVVHTTLLVPDDDPMFLADQTTTAVVVQNVTLSPIDHYRIIASRRN